MNISQELLDSNPFCQPDPADPFGYKPWPACWIKHPTMGDAPSVTAFRCRFVTEQDESSIRLHLSADNRFELFLDGIRVGCGPERGAPQHWFFHTYRLDEVPPGDHVLVARVWYLGRFAPAAQITVHPGFILAADGDQNQRIATTAVNWQTKRLEGYTFAGVQHVATGGIETINGTLFPWGWESGDGEGWESATEMKYGQSAGYFFGCVNESHQLRPAMLPAMMDKPWHGAKVRMAEPLSADIGELSTIPLSSHASSEPLRAQWQSLLDIKAAVTVGPHQVQRLIIDMRNYLCAYPEIVLSGGLGATVKLEWAEGLYEQTPAEHHTSKGNRNEIEGKYFHGYGDTWHPDGGSHRVFSPVWWRPGRYVQVLVRTQEHTLSIEHLAFRETRYPFEPESVFDCNDPQISAISPILVRGMQMCMHETYFDCPYYEQLMYVGDTRLEVLTTYALTGDDRLPRKAVAAFDWSRIPMGLTRSNYPSRGTQVIPPFSLWWVCMVHDFALWRGDREYLRSFMPGVRAVMERFRVWVNGQGLVEGPDGWNFVDWVPRWHTERWGVPPDGNTGVSSIICWQFVLALQSKAELERWFGEEAMATRDEELARTCGAAIVKHFWCSEKSMLADTLAHDLFSEHCQCLALLSGLLPEEISKKVADSLFSRSDIERTTIYFSHYYFEACRVAGRLDMLFHRLEDWFALSRIGLTTPLEQPEPSRSDCHAWGSHPLFHFRATVLGIRPAMPGFERVRVEPQLGHLEHAEGTIPHPQGQVSVSVRRSGNLLTGTVRLPDGVNGELIVNGENMPFEGEISF